MRTLHADLTTAQKDASRTPYIKLTIISRDRATTRTYQTTDATNRILFVQQAEGRFGGDIVSPGSRQPVAGIIRLKDHDNSLIGLDWKGYRVDIDWGFNTSSGNRVPDTGPEPLFVINQKSFTLEGELILELHLMSLWGYVRTLWLNTTTAGPLEFKRGDASLERTVKQILHELLGGVWDISDPDPNLWNSAAVQFDASGPTYTIYTDKAGDVTADNVLIFPTTPAVGDIFYVAQINQFDRVTWDLTTVGSGLTLAVEYWNGTTWALTQNGVDGTSSFSTGVLKVMKFDRPTDWATKNMDADVDSAFPNKALYYIRFRLTAVSAPAQPKATRIFVAMDLAVSLDTTNSLANFDYKPTYKSNFQQNISSTLDAILGRTRLGIVAEEFWFSARYIDNAQATPDYTYGTDHDFHAGMLKDAPIVPNKITVTNIPPSGATRFEGSASNSSSITALGTITEVRVQPEIANDAEGAAQAQVLIDALVRDAAQADLDVPMNVGQEMWDLVETQDTRSGKTFKGRVSQLVRRYEPGIYRLRIIMGDANKLSVVRSLRARGFTDVDIGRRGEPRIDGVSADRDIGRRFRPVSLFDIPESISARIREQVRGFQASGLREINLLTGEVIDISVSSPASFRGILPRRDGGDVGLDTPLMDSFIERQRWLNDADFVTGPIDGVGFISGEELFDGAIGADQIADGSVGSVELVDLSVTTAKLAALAVTNAKLAAAAVAVANIQDLAVTGAKIANLAITETKISSGAISTPKLQANAITANEIAADAVTAVKILAGSITAVKIQAGTITANKISADTITANEIVANTITSAEIAALTITVNELAANSVEADKIKANAVTAAKLEPTLILTTEVRASTVRINSSGVHIVGTVVSDASSVLRFENPLGTLKAAMWLSDIEEVVISAANQLRTDSIVPRTTGRVLGSLGIPWATFDTLLCATDSLQAHAIGQTFIDVNDNFDMKQNRIFNIGSNNVNFDSTGQLDMSQRRIIDIGSGNASFNAAGDLNMSTQRVFNIGTRNSQFTSDGQLFVFGNLRPQLKVDSVGAVDTQIELRNQGTLEWVIGLLQSESSGSREIHFSDNTIFSSVDEFRFKQNGEASADVGWVTHSETSRKRNITSFNNDVLAEMKTAKLINYQMLNIVEPDGREILRAAPLSQGYLIESVPQYLHRDDGRGLSAMCMSAWNTRGIIQLLERVEALEARP